MNFTTLLLLALVGTVHSSVASSCKPNCKQRTECKETVFKHVSNLQNSSVAPWSLSVNSQVGREPAHIHYAHCMDCTVAGMIPKPILFQISVYEMIRTGSGPACCECPFDVAVGCTCVNKQ